MLDFHVLFHTVNPCEFHVANLTRVGLNFVVHMFNVVFQTMIRVVAFIADFTAESEKLLVIHSDVDFESATVSGSKCTLSTFIISDFEVDPLVMLYKKIN